MFLCCYIFCYITKYWFFLLAMHIKNHHGDDIIKMKNFYPHKDMNTLCILLLFCRHNWGKFLSQHRCSSACCCLQGEKADLGTLMFVYNNIKVCSVNSVLHFLFTVEKGTPQYFDAFICYSPQGEDLTFVKEMITKLENPPHNLKLFVPWRDDLPGGSRYVIDARLIEMR